MKVSIHCIWFLSFAILAGCSSPAIRNSSIDRAPGEETYDYYAVTDNCNCIEFTAAVPGYKVEYALRANYSVDTTIVTYIAVEFRNNSSETLRLDAGVVKISSKNISYQYNDKFLPLPEITVDAHSKEHVLLTGKDLHASPSEWNKIAGERLTVVLKGIHLGEKELPQQEVTFVPENPKMKHR